MKNDVHWFLRIFWFSALRGVSAGDGEYYGVRWYLQLGPLLIFIGKHPDTP